ncbi:MAG: penicillin-binding protein 1C [bacterium]
MQIKLTKTHAKILLVLALFVAKTAFVVWAVLPVLKGAEARASTKVFDRNGTLLDELPVPSEGLRTPVPLKQMPSELIEAVLLAEDERFYEHWGVDVTSIARAAWTNVTNRRLVSGASTITNQLIKNLYFSSEPRSIIEKIREAEASVAYTALHSKDEVLENYLNTVYFGRGTYGVEAAAFRYFRKDVSSLSLAESATLAGMIAAPNSNDPISHALASGARRTWVLERLKNAGKISESQFSDASGTKLTLFGPSNITLAPHFVSMALSEAEEIVPGIKAGGYQVVTTLDLNTQKTAENIVTRKLSELATKSVGNAALVVMNPKSGDIEALVGSADFSRDEIAGQVNMATAKRQPGSALKPFLYTLAFLKGYSPATVVPDLPIRFETATEAAYYPRNYNYVYHGPVSIRMALGSSLNIPAVKMLDAVGLKDFFGFLEKFGLSFPEEPEHYGLGVVLGGGEVTLLDTTEAYTILANGGAKVPASFVLEIKDAAGQTVWRRPEVQAQNIFKDEPDGEAAIALINNILSDNKARALSFGEANLLDTGKNYAVKTGTTRNFVDNWAFGYSEDLVVGVWVGNSDGSPMEGVTGVSGAVPIWHDLVLAIHGKQPKIVWRLPDRVVTRVVCDPSGLLATELCAKRRSELFIAGTEPKQLDDWYKSVDGGTAYLKPPPEYDEWQRSKNLVGSVALAASTTEAITILQPLDKDVYLIDSNFPLEAQRIPFTASGAQGIYEWRLNNQEITASTPTYLFTPQVGEYTLTLEGSQNTIHFTVR